MPVRIVSFFLPHMLHSFRAEKSHLKPSLGYFSPALFLSFVLFFHQLIREIALTNAYA